MLHNGAVNSHLDRSCICHQRLSNGSIDPDSEIQRVMQLQETVEKQNSELTLARSKVNDLGVKVKELEEALASSQKDVVRLQEQNVKLQRDIREVSVMSSLCCAIIMSRCHCVKSPLCHVVMQI